MGSRNDGLLRRELDASPGTAERSTRSGSMTCVLTEEFSWRGRVVRWERIGSGPNVVFCHGTPWSSELWRP